MMAKRKYGHRHRQIRKALIPFAIGQPCLHCGRVMLAGDQLDLDHRADGFGYRGIVHAECNRREGGRRGGRRRPRRGVIFP